MRNVIFILLVLVATLNASAQDRETRFGLISKAEFNRLAIESTDRIAENKFQKGSQSAAGVYAAVNLGRHWFLDASVLISRAKYTPGYTQSGAVFIDADVRFTQFNLNLNLVLNPHSEKVKIFVFGGAQLLYRRWGEERYINDIIPKSYWPSYRVMPQAGLGVKCPIGRGFYLQPFAGLRYATDHQLVYDVTMNQVFAGAVLCYGIAGKKKNRYNKCFSDF